MANSKDGSNYKMSYGPNGQLSGNRNFPMRNVSNKIDSNVKKSKSKISYYVVEGNQQTQVDPNNLNNFPSRLPLKTKHDPLDVNNVRLSNYS